jgi:hypothetical protein
METGDRPTPPRKQQFVEASLVDARKQCPYKQLGFEMTAKAGRKRAD